MLVQLLLCSILSSVVLSLLGLAQKIVIFTNGMDHEQQSCANCWPQNSRQVIQGLLKSTNHLKSLWSKEVIGRQAVD